MSKLLEILIANKKIGETEAHEMGLDSLADAELENYLVRNKILPFEGIYEAKASLLNIPFRSVEPQDVPSDILMYVPEETAQFYGIMPLKRAGNILEVGMINPTDLKALDALKFITRQKDITAKIFLISPQNFELLLKKYSSLKEEVSEAVQELAGEIEKTVQQEAEEVLLEETTTEEAPVMKIVSVILRHAFEGNASDIHIEPLETRSRVRYRLDGVLYTSLLLPKQLHEALITRVKILSNLRIDERRIPQDGRFKIKAEGKEVDFRVAILPTQFGEKATLRVLDTRSGIRTLTDLGIYGRNLRLIEEASRRPFGLILITGPTGSGKSTTLYSILNILNRDGVNVVTLEDPIEYYLEGINQSQIRPDIGYSFAEGMRAMVRQDPDIIMVGEVRDAETAGLAIHSALTGHVVLSTLHTNNALGVVPRLLEMGVEKYLLPTAMSIAVAQRLVRKLCQFCKKPTKIAGRAKEIIEETFAKMQETGEKRITFSENTMVYQPQGCPKCNNKGTKGRIGIYEVLEMTKQLEAIIMGTPTENSLKEEVKRQKMLTMRQDGIIKAMQGLVSMEDVLATINE